MAARATVKAKGGGDKPQRRLSLSKTGLGLQEPKTKARYAPPEHFKSVDGAESLVQETLDGSTELWLVRIPANEISQDDLMEKSLRITVDSADGQVGHFFSLQGQEYRIVKQNYGDFIQPYAVIPTESGPFQVRKVLRQVGFVRNLGVTRDLNAPETSSQHDQVQSEVEDPDRRTVASTDPQKPADKSHKKKRRRDHSGNN